MPPKYKRLFAYSHLIAMSQGRDAAVCRNEVYLLNRCRISVAARSLQSSGKLRKQ